MTVKDTLRTELAELVAKANEAVSFLSGLNEDSEFLDFHGKYQDWYSRSLRLVEKLASDRYLEFRRYYEPDPKRKTLGPGDFVIQDYLKNLAPNKLRFPDFDTRQAALIALFNQKTILSSIANRIDSILFDLEGTLFAELQDIEIKEAFNLIPINSRAAGALAGVMLEAYLQKIARSHETKIPKKNPTISDLNDQLKQQGIYDIPTWRKISYLGDIRNLCSHQKTTEPTIEQVKELISGVDWVIKNVF